MAPLDVTKNNFDAEVLESSQLVLADFWATWCGPCKMQAPVLDELCQERGDVKFVKVNVDEQFELAVRYQVSSIPTLIFFKDGKVVRKAVGFREKPELEALLEECLHEHPTE